MSVHMNVTNERADKLKAIDYATNVLLDTYRELRSAIEQGYTDTYIRELCRDIKLYENALSKAILE